MIAITFLITLGTYLACGFIFAIAFAWVGAKRVDPHAAAGTRGFRLLIIPGVMAFWPLFLKRWWSDVKHPPEEHNAHRIAAESPTRPAP